MGLLTDFVLLDEFMHVKHLDSSHKVVAIFVTLLYSILSGSGKSDYDPHFTE